MRLVLSLWILCCINLPVAHAQVKVWEGTLQLAASDENPPDENPNFDTFADLEDYPYPMRQTMRTTETVHTWRALILENEYLKCTILPQLGGHIYTCVDKINNTPMFYANPSLKKQSIAYRGAWAAFGEEFNFPVSHNWVTQSPVDWAYATAPDGSASITVGNRDRVYGMDWTVEIVLRPGSTLLEEHVTLSNHSDARHHYFWWNNAGVQVWPDSHIDYPTQFIRDNGSDDTDTWPINLKGTDLSVISREKGDFDAFAYGSHEPFLGVYSPHTDSGTVHYADPAVLPGKKIYSWGNDDNARFWSSLLSDDHSQYVEIQSGLFKDQVTYQFLEPRQSVRFTEYWMPVRGIGSITRANLEGVVSMQRTPEPGGGVALSIGLNANHAIAGAKIAVSNGDKNILDEAVSLDPAVTWKHTIPNLPAGKTYTFLLTGANGEPLLKHTEGVYDLVPRDQVRVGPAPQPPAPDPATQPPVQTDADLLTNGTNIELQGDYLNALDAFNAGLAKFPTSLPLLKAAGRLSDALWRFDDAATLLGKAAARAPADAEVHYYRAIADSALNHPAEARADLEAATHSPAFRAPAGLLLAELLARQHDLPGALQTLEADCPASLHDLRCTEETIALQRAAGAADRARTLAADALSRFPTGLFLRNEVVKLAVHPKAGTTLPDIDRQLAADTTRILNLVHQYNRLGLYPDSLDLLSRSYAAVAPEDSEPDAPLPWNDPLLSYYRGFCRQKLGKSAAEDYVLASRLPLLYIFPNDPEDIPVLRAALAANPSDASAHFLLGTLYFSKGIVDPALDEWKQAEALNPKIPALQASIGRVLLEVKKQPAEAMAEFQQGLQLEPGNALLYLELNQAMKQTGSTPAQRVAMLQNYPDFVNMPYILMRALFDALNDAGRPADADAVLQHRFVPRKEAAARQQQ